MVGVASNFFEEVVSKVGVARIFSVFTTLVISYIKIPLPGILVLVFVVTLVVSAWL